MLGESRAVRTTLPPYHPIAAIQWHLIIEPEARSGAENMAVDYSLLHKAREGVAFLRLYRWSPGCLSFGRNETARVRYDAAAITRLGLDTVRRPTGGRAVWHDTEVTYAVAGPAGMFGSLLETYIRIHAMIATALERCGVPAQLADRPNGRAVNPGGGACFASPARGEIVVGGRKLVGSAQVREGGNFLQHGSVLLANGQDVVTRVTRRESASPAATSLATVLDRAVDFNEVAGAIAAEAEASWHGIWRNGAVDCESAYVARFSSPVWTWRR